MANDPKRVLAVDDNADCLMFVKAVLQPEGYAVVTATNGQEGLDKLAAEKPDLVILDVMMPVLNGYEACEEIKSDESTENIPVILLTGVAKEVSTSTYSHRGGMATQADDYIAKPIDPDTLLSAVRRLLGDG